MRYDLLVQSADPKTPYDATALNELLARRGVQPGADGRTFWKLKNGEVEVKPLIEGGTLLATELRVPLSERLELIREVVVEATALASEAKARVFDPQLAKALTPADDGVVADQYFRTAKYAGSMMGVTEALGAGFETPASGPTVTTKMLLVAGGILLLLYLVMDKLTGALGGE